MPLLTLLVVATYAGALYLIYADRSVRPLLLLLAGSVATLLQPLWGRLYGTGPSLPGSVIRVGESVTFPLWTLVGGGVLLALPAFIVMHGLRHRWGVQHYAAAWGFFLAFILFFFVVDAFETRQGLAIFARPELPDADLPQSLLRALLLAGISFGLLYSFVSTRHYAMQIAFVPLLISGFAASLLLLGILCSPFWVARLLRQSDRVELVGAAIGVLLVLWAIHLLASGFHAGRQQRLQWR
jgi:hypothetical protein